MFDRSKTRIIALGATALALALATSCLAGCGAPPRPVAALPLPQAGKVLPPAAGAYFGVFDPPAPFDGGTVDSFQSTAGKHVSIVMWYQPWATTNRWKFDRSACAKLMQDGTVPMITWEPWDPGNNAKYVVDPANQPQWRLSEITAGRYDSYIRTWARQIRDLGGPVMLRPAQEMNGDWYPWGGTVNGNTAGQYIAAWRHIHDVFAGERANNVTWVWSVNHHSHPPTAANAYGAYYPGDAYVDWVAVSGFNFGKSTPVTNWRTFKFWYDEPLAYLHTLPKPICIAEFGSVEQGGSKAQWLRDAFAFIKADPQVRAVLYYNTKDVGRTTVQDWRIDTSRASRIAFRRSVEAPYFVGEAPRALVDWAASLAPVDMLRLSLARRLY